MLSVWNVNDDKSVISDEVNAFVTLISLEVSLLKSLISTLIVLNVNDDKSDNSLLIFEFADANCTDNSLEV